MAARTPRELMSKLLRLNRLDGVGPVCSHLYSYSQFDENNPIFARFLIR